MDVNAQLTLMVLYVSKNAMGCLQTIGKNIQGNAIFHFLPFPSPT